MQAPAPLLDYRLSRLHHLLTTYDATLNMSTAHQPAKYPMVVDHKAMTIAVGDRVFDKPDLTRRPEWDFEFKAEICGFPETERRVKTWNKFYAEMLGCKFNWRFFGANYALWIGGKMSRQTGNMLRFEGKNWFRFDSELVRRAHAILPYINEAERDGLYNLVPIIIAFDAPPQTIRAEIGRGAWRRVANNSISRNTLLMNATRRAGKPAFVKLLEMPSGVLRVVHTADEDEIIAARISPRKRPRVFLETLHAVRDTRRMLLPTEFNPNWGYARFRQEHEVATRAIMQRRYSDKKFAPEWSFEEKGYSAHLLTSQAEIATEGEVQHHCVGSYAREAAIGRYAVFKIDGKERATAGVVNGRVDQIYRACNAPVSDECREFSHTLATKYAAHLRSAVKAA